MMALNFIQKNPLAKAFYENEGRHRAFDQADLAQESGQEKLRQSQEMHPLHMERTQASIDASQGQESRARDLHGPSLGTANANATVAQETVQPRIQQQQAAGKSAFANARVAEQTVLPRVDIAQSQAAGQELINTQRAVQNALQLAGSGMIDQGVAGLRAQGLEVSDQDAQALQNAEVRKAIGEMRGVLDAQFGHDPKAYLSAVRQVWDNTRSGKPPFEGVIASSVPKPASNATRPSTNIVDAQILASALAASEGRSVTQQDFLTSYDQVRAKSSNQFERTKLVANLAQKMLESDRVLALSPDGQQEAIQRATTIVDSIARGAQAGAGMPGATTAPQAQQATAQPLPPNPEQLQVGGVYQTSRGPLVYKGLTPDGQLNWGRPEGQGGAGSPEDVMRRNEGTVLSPR